MARSKIRPLPNATFDNIRLALAYYLASNESAVFVQIGACDGTTGDSVHEFVRKGKLRAILVEPIEGSFKKLKKVCEGIPNVSVIQAAIAPIDGSMTLFKVKEGGAKHVDVNWAPQFASFDRNHLCRHGIPSNDIEEVIVPAFTLKSLLNRFNLDRVTILQIDTEGFDAEIVKLALDLPHLPECINFENLHLRGDTLEELFEQLQKHGYVWTHDHWNTLALHKTLIDSWL